MAATDPNPALRAELLAAKAILDPQIRGLRHLATPDLSDELNLSISEQVVIRERRDILVQAVLDQLDATLAALVALYADGYPILPPVVIVAPQFDELQADAADIAAALAIFNAQSQTATRLSVGLGVPAAKPKPPAT
jgi:hypothetical protein